ARSDGSTRSACRLLDRQAKRTVARGPTVTMTATVLNLLDLRAFTGDLVAALAGPDEVGEPVDVVRAIIADVRARGDVAIRELTAQFDGCSIDALLVPPEQSEAALTSIPAEVRAALEYAAGEIRAYHAAQGVDAVDVDRDGVQARELV